MSLVDGVVKLSLNEKALPELAESSELEDAKSVFSVSATEVGLRVKTTDPHLWYGLAYAAKLGVDFAPPAADTLVQGVADEVIELNGESSGNNGFYRIYVTDIEPQK